MRENRISKEGWENLQAKLEHMKTEKRAEIVQAISEARAFGDLSENAEYEAAKNDQALLEKQIAELESQLKTAVVVNEISSDSEVATLGSKVRFRIKGRDGIQTYTLVSPLEADLDSGKLSMSSPIGQSLLGARKGDDIVALLPSGKKKNIHVTNVS